MNDVKQVRSNDAIMSTLLEVRARLQEAKPSERGELARRYQVTVTELEKVIGYFDTFILKGFGLEKE